MGTRSGRRPGASGTREAIAASARRLFGEGGYDRVTLRAIGADAGVDPALVVHYFGTKERLFLDAVGLPVEPEEVVRVIVDGPRGQAGMRVARFLLGLLEHPERRAHLTAMVRAAASEPSAAEALRALLTRRVFLPVAEALGADDAALRANLVGSQVVGLTMARHVVGVEPLASTPPDVLVAAIAPTLQRYLTGPLD